MKDTVREAFEAWLDKNSPLQITPTYLEVFKAGRESMRKEAVDECENWWFETSADRIGLQKAIKELP